ncbi:MAG: hypothetical protein AB2A00_07315 [Myxococcota bacterium]
MFQYPDAVTLRSGDNAPVLYGRVFVDGVTQGAGGGAGISAEVGFGPAGDAPSAQSWTWTGATYARDVDGLISGDQANDEYEATVSAPPTGTWVMAYRFSLTGGASWRYCDLAGPTSSAEVLSSGADLQVAALTVDYCELNRPNSANVETGVASAPFHGRVYVEGRTPGDGAATGIRGQVGHGLETDDPATWTWVDATYTADVDGLVPNDKANDEYTGSVTVDTEGTYRVGYRFSVDDGANWTLCDLDGSANGFSATSGATLEATSPTPTISVCRYEGPDSIVLHEGNGTPAITGRVTVPNLTEGAGPGAGVLAQVGYGPLFSSPEDNTWIWQDATYAGDADLSATADADEYTTTLTAPARGAYALAYRFSVDGGVSWMTCDRDGSLNGYAVDQSGVMETRKPVEWCNLQYPPTTTTTVGAMSENIYGQVSVDGLTDANDQAPDVIAELGHGPVGVAPSDAAWQWAATGYNAFHVSEADEYVGQFNVGVSGQFNYTFRYSTDDGQTWCYGTLLDPRDPPACSGEECSYGLLTVQ